MILQNKCLTLFLLLYAGVVNAQVKIEKSLEKYTLSHINGVNALDTLVLVKFDKALSPAEILKYKPLKSFSSTDFIVNEGAFLNYPSKIIYKNKVNALWKASEKLITLWEQSLTSNKTLVVRLALKNRVEATPNFLNGYKVLNADLTNKTITIEILARNLLSVLGNPEVLLADVIQKAKEEIIINGLDLAVNGVSNVHSVFPNIDGKGIVLSVKEGMFDINDIDFLGKIAYKTTDEQTAHATIMATLAAGSGNSFIKGLGVAPAAKLASSSFTNLMPDDINQLHNINVSVQNHSYGTDVDNTYGIEAAAYDKQVFEADTLMHVFSAGNKGNAIPTLGIYKDIEGRANLTGNFKQAKNNLVVGGINRENITEGLSSKGPTYDGRVKPDLVALGEDGTSGAAALTSGVVALLQQQYHAKFGKMPSTALVRSVLINSADDLGNQHVDYENGFGKLNALKAVQTIAENRFKVAEIAEGESFTLPVQVQANQKEIKVTLVWNDLAASVNSLQSIVNHLDLSLEAPAGQVILPWVLSAYPNIDSLSKPAERKIDNLNTIQQITLANITPGNYLIRVKGRKVSQSKQSFSIAYQLTALNTFNWSYPENDEQLIANDDAYVRWDNTFSATSGQLSVSFDDGLNWEILNSNITLSANFYKWHVPNKFGRAQLKMQIAGQDFKSKSFIISAPLTLKVGFNCADAVYFQWNKQPEALNYTLYNIKDDKLVAVSTVTDTSLLVNKTDASSPYFAVSANGQGFNGLKSYTINYNTQGISCYTKNFTASVVNNQINLDLGLGSTYNLKKIIWEKQTSINTFSVLSESNIVANSLNYSYTDLNPKVGVQFYRVTFETNDGVKIQSEMISIAFLKADDYVFYPNPVDQNLTILNGSFDTYNLKLFNVIGRKVFEENANGTTKQYDVSRLVSGLYIGVISKNGAIFKQFKMIKK